MLANGIGGLGPPHHPTPALTCSYLRREQGVLTPGRERASRRELAEPKDDDTFGLTILMKLYMRKLNPRLALERKEQMKSCPLVLRLGLRCGAGGGGGTCIQKKESNQSGALDLSSALTLRRTLSKLLSGLELCHVNNEDNNLSV